MQNKVDTLIASIENLTLDDTPSVVRIDFVMPELAKKFDDVSEELKD